jgi:hypothetical protein
MEFFMLTHAHFVSRRASAGCAAALLLAGGMWGLAASAQTIFRCPTAGGITAYTNDANEASRMGCTPMTGGNVTVVQSRAPTPAAAATPSGTRVAAASPSPAGSRIDSSEQRARDSDAKQILESELKKAEAKLTELKKEYNNGEPEKQGPEHRNHQKYLDRTAELKANIARTENDIDGIRKEIARTR